MSNDKILTASEIYNNMHDAIVSILTIENNCKFSSTGFVFKHTGYNPGLYIITVAHAVFSKNGHRDKYVDSIYATVPNFNGTGKHVFNKCEVIGVAGYTDIAVLKFDNLEMDKHNYVKIGDDIKIGNKCYVIGNPIGAEICSLVEGIVRNSSFISKNTVECISFTAPTLKGNSGSPVFNNKGDVCSIVSNGMPGGDNFNFGTKGYIIKHVVEYIISNNSNFIGGTINCSLYPVDNTYMYHYKFFNNSVRGYCIKDSKNNLLKDFDSIVSINDVEIGTYYNQSSPCYIYLNSGKEIKLGYLSKDTKKESIIHLTIDQLSTYDDVYRQH